MATDLSSIAGALKQVYGQYNVQQNLKHKALDEIAKSLTKYSNGGQGYFGAINDYGNESGGAINETESFRTIDNEDYVQFKVVPKIIVWPIQFSGLSAAAGDQDDESFVNIVTDALDMAKERMLKDENRQFFGNGKGTLGSPAGTVSSAATSFSVDSAQYFRANMVVDICTAGSSTEAISSIRISQVDKVNNVLYFAASIGASLTVANEIVKENIRASQPSDGKEMMGLRGIVDDATDLTTFENINALTQLIWRGRRIDASSANLTSDLLQRLLDDVEVLGGDAPDTIIMHQRQRRKYLDIVVPQKRYMDGKLDAGFEKLSFNGKDLFLDEDCQVATVYALTKKHIQKYELKGLTMGGYEDSDTFLRAVNQDVYQAFWKHYCNFGSGKRNAHGKLVSLALPTGVS
jgi:Mor family transcriptional regulator